MWTVGDIVSVTGMDDNIYYCQLRGFMTDECGFKSAAITWLVPSTFSPPPSEGFDPATYTIGRIFLSFKLCIYFIYLFLYFFIFVTRLLYCFRCKDMKL